METASPWEGCLGGPRSCLSSPRPESMRTPQQHEHPSPHALGPRQSLSSKLPPGRPPHRTCSWGLPYDHPHCPLLTSTIPVRWAGSAESPVLSLPLSGLPPAQPGPCRTCWCLWRSLPTALQHRLLTHSLPSPTSVYTAPVWVLPIALRTSYECLGLSLSLCPFMTQW